MNVTLTPHDLHLLLHAEHMDPFAVLGLQSVGGASRTGVFDLQLQRERD